MLYEIAEEVGDRTGEVSVRGSRAETYRITKSRVYLRNTYY